ncbi:MAG: transcription termination factor Rho [candidate division KSB1 bacterium]|nr:transcription termination factor Rho [candidate division KSB1 bacterium]MDZ7304913.1 transcription termination factor Rho [candidate division KSB1 bacterium]MDZ7313951.1 transcription termination factor Rho [candidate division KSB1 bacterium]
MSETFTGLLEIDDRRRGFLRKISLVLNPQPGDPFVPRDLIEALNLRAGTVVEAEIIPGARGGRQIGTVLRVNGRDPAEWTKLPELESLVAVTPNEQIVLETRSSDSAKPKQKPSGETSMRVVDLISPLGKGQRALIVSPPRSGKTMLLQQMAQAIGRNYPEIHVIVLLLDERPEEVTDMRRAVTGEVFASSNDAPIESHLRLAQLVTEYAKRRVECGEDVVLLLDSLTRTGRAFNLAQRGSGRTMTGGLDARALEIPRRIFGAGRKIEGGGSLTIVATILVGTGSRMDEFIFEEFKGTGNMELVLDRGLADQRIFPAINIPASGTRREELLFGKQTPQHQALRRALHGMPPKEAMNALLKAIAATPDNKALLKKFAEA